ncbi:HAD-superfamily hydrolase subfamily IG 5'-nucleotidase [Trinorchestia longiramus]|nr:HAD-superfamily hydrolase subfamily IG 5'-nucleotidase [Trinorchestia longiramus]
MRVKIGVIVSRLTSANADISVSPTASALFQRLTLPNYWGMSTQQRPYSQEFLRKSYADHKALWERKKLPENVDSQNVFVSNELELRSIDVYGFDYDYTLANYESSVEYLIYQLGRDNLINKYKYPKEIKEFSYDPKFAVRGLHYDIEQGLLMKLDQFQQIQMSSIYRGLTPLSSAEVTDTYGSRALPLSYVEGHLRGFQFTRSLKQPYPIPNKLPKKQTMAHLADLFSLPEMCLLSQVTQYFIDHKLPFHSVSIFNDVKESIGSIHPEMHRIVGANMGNYLKKEPNLEIFFNRIKEHGKKVFIITNSPFHFVNVGMQYLLGPDWREYFDVVVAGAKKPAFFVDRMRPFRELDTTLGVQSWGPVECLEKGKIYIEGNLSELQRLKGWRGERVLYFGDHPYSDLADVTLNHCWRTGAIIWELEHETECLNSEEFKKTIGWLQMLQSLIESAQDYEDSASREVVREWVAERDDLRQRTKELFNPHFGSVFRTHDNPTYFSRRLFRFADIYTCRLTNLNNYSINHTFYPSLKGGDDSTQLCFLLQSFPNVRCVPSLFEKPLLLCLQRVFHRPSLLSPSATIGWHDIVNSRRCRSGIFVVAGLPRQFSLLEFHYGISMRLIAYLQDKMQEPVEVYREEVCSILDRTSTEDVLVGGRKVFFVDLIVLHLKVPTPQQQHSTPYKFGKSKLYCLLFTQQDLVRKSLGLWLSLRVVQSGNDSMMRRQDLGDLLQPTPNIPRQQGQIPNIYREAIEGNQLTSPKGETTTTTTGTQRNTGGTSCESSTMNSTSTGNNNELRLSTKELSSTSTTIGSPKDDFDDAFRDLQYIQALAEIDGIGKILDPVTSRETNNIQASTVMDSTEDTENVNKTKRTTKQPTRKKTKITRIKPITRARPTTTKLPTKKRKTTTNRTPGKSETDGIINISIFPKNTIISRINITKQTDNTPKRDKTIRKRLYNSLCNKGRSRHNDGSDSTPSVSGRNTNPIRNGLRSNDGSFNENNSKPDDTI